MNLRQKLGYIATGSVLMIVGTVAINLMADFLMPTKEIVTVGSALALVGILSVFVTAHSESSGRSSHDQITCRKLTVVDEKGTPCVFLTANRDGGFLSIRDKTGTFAIGLSATEAGGDIAVRDNVGEVVAALFAVEGGGKLTLFDNAGTRAALMYANEAEVRVAVTDEEGKVAADLNTNEFGGKVSVWNKAGANVADLHAVEGGGGGLDIYKAGTPKPMKLRARS